MRTRLNEEEKKAGYELNRLLSGTCYPRNGNVHNPTLRYTWQLMFKGRQIGMVYSAGAALELVEEHKKVEGKRAQRKTP